MIKKVINSVFLLLVCLIYDPLFSSTLTPMDDSPDKNLSSKERFFFESKSPPSPQDPTPSNDVNSNSSSSQNPDPLSNDQLMDKFSQDFIPELLSGSMDEVGEYIQKNPIYASDLSTLDNSEEMLQKASLYISAHSEYLKALEYFEQKKKENDPETFNTRFTRKLFQYKNDTASVFFAPVAGKVMVTVILKEQPDTAYNFYVYNPTEEFSDTDESINKEIISQYKNILKEIDVFTSKQHMKGLNTVTARLDSEHRPLSFERSDYPTAFRDPLRYCSEYLKSIIEKPQIAVGLMSTFIQIAVLVTLKYIQSPAGATLGSVLTESPLSMAIIATYAMIISSNVGTYRNFIDSGSLPARITKDTLIGLSFAYSLTLAEGGASSLSLFSLSGILNNLYLLAITGLNKWFKYPIVYIIRNSTNFGYYGANGEVNGKYFGLTLNKKSVHSQLIYNGVSFGLKLMALLGLTVTINKAQYQIGPFLFVTVPIVFMFINSHWIKNEYKAMLKKYIKDPSGEHKVGLQRRTVAFDENRKYVYTLKSLYYKAIGFLSGSFILDRKQQSLSKPYADFNENDFLSLTKKQISKLNISQLQKLIAFYITYLRQEDRRAELEAEEEDRIIDLLVEAKMVYADKRKTSTVLNKVIESSKTRSIPAAVSGGCTMLFTTFF